MDIIEKYPDKPWYWGQWGISENRNLTFDIIEKFPDKPWYWGYCGISSNPNLTLDIIEKFPNKPWHWGTWGISENPNLTMEWIEKFPDKPWYWNSYGNGINNNPFTKEKELFELRVNKQKFVQDHLFESFVKKAYHPDRIERILNELEEEDPDRDNLEYMEEWLL